MKTLSWDFSSFFFFLVVNRCVFLSGLFIEQGETKFLSWVVFVTGVQGKDQKQGVGRAGG